MKMIDAIELFGLAALIGGCWVALGVGWALMLLGGLLLGVAFSYRLRKK